MEILSEQVLTLAHKNKQHTLGHINCPACIAEKSMLACSITADLTFQTAAALYMQIRSVAATPGAISARYIKPNTENDYSRRIKSISLFFENTRLADIHWYNMRAYQKARVAGEAPFIRYRRPQDAKPRKVGGVELPPKGKTPCPAKPQQVNQEMAFLKMLKIKAGCWTEEDEAYFEHLIEEESDAERALSPEQQQRWLDVCRSNPRWEMILWYSLVAFHTLMSTNELRGLQIGNVNMHHRMIRVPWPAAKNRFRHRDIPLEDPEAIWALERLIQRAHDLGARDPQHFLFPFKITRSKVAFPTRPMTESGIKKLWQEVREASGIEWFRPYDTRHTGATRFAESAVPTEIIVARMGHCSERMRKHYTHISEQAQRAWLQPQPVFQHAWGMRPQPQPVSYSPANHLHQSPIAANGYPYARKAFGTR